MTVHIREEMIQVTTSEDVSAPGFRYKGLTWAGAVAQDNKRPAGIMKFGATSGGIASVILEGITKGDTASAITTAGWPVKFTTSGWLTAAASGDQVIGRYIGQTAAASGDRIPVVVDGKCLSFWSGQ